MLVKRVNTAQGQDIEVYSQRRHAHYIPEILLAEDML